MPKLKKSAPKKRKKQVMKKEMDLFAEGKMHSGSKKGPVVKNPRQAIAIALNVSGQSRKRKKKAQRK